MLISVEFCIDIGTFGLVFMSQRQRQKCKLLNVFDEQCLFCPLY